MDLNIPREVTLTTTLPQSVFGMAFGVIGLDIYFRLTMIEKKVAAKWQDTSLKRDQHRAGSLQSDLLGFESEPSSAKSFKSSPTTEPQNKSQRTPIIFILLRSPRLLFTLWSSMVPMMILAAFENVRYIAGLPLKSDN